MNDQVQNEAAEEVVRKTTIRPNLARYIRDKSGNGKRTQRTDDLVARTLAGKDIEHIKNGATELGIDWVKWEHLNVGQQRMLIGNAIRHKMAQIKEPLTAERLAEVYGDPVPEHVPAEEAEQAEGEQEEVVAAPTRRTRKHSEPVKAPTE